MPIHLRPMNVDTDFPRIAEIINTFNPEPASAQQLQEDEASAPTDRLIYRMNAVNDEGLILGYSWIRRNPWMPEERFWFRVTVDPLYKNAGIGSLLYDDGLRFVKDHGGNRLDVTIRDSDTASLDFAAHRGFKVIRHVYDSILDLSTFDEGRFVGIIESLENAGIRFTTLAEAGNTSENQRRIYDLDVQVNPDIPGEPMIFPPFEEYCKTMLGGAMFIPDGAIIAADGERWVGFTILGYARDIGLMINEMTGVHRDYRGRHIALALKLLAIRRARRYGVTTIRTNNDSENAPMLAVNRKLGYRPVPGYYVVKNEW